MLLHIQEKIIDNYRSNWKNKKKIAHVFFLFIIIKSNNSDNALQIKPAFWWIKNRLALKRNE